MILPAHASVRSPRWDFTPCAASASLRRSSDCRTAEIGCLGTARHPGTDVAGRDHGAVLHQDLSVGAAGEPDFDLAAESPERDLEPGVVVQPFLPEQEL